VIEHFHFVLELVRAYFFCTSLIGAGMLFMVGVLKIKFPEEFV